MEQHAQMTRNDRRDDTDGSMDWNKPAHGLARKMDPQITQIAQMVRDIASYRDHPDSEELVNSIPDRPPRALPNGRDHGHKCRSPQFTEYGMAGRVARQSDQSA